MLNYYEFYEVERHSVTGERRIVYSIDMVEFYFKLPRDFNISYFEQIGFLMRYHSDKDFAYKYYLEKFSGETTMRLFLCFNGCTKEDNKRCKLIYNPNKVTSFDIDLVNKFFFRKDIKLNCKCFDLAVDFYGYDRKLFGLNKTGNNTYSLIYKSIDNFTEYLGIHNQNGFTKLYNKGCERGVDDKIVRFETTIFIDKIDKTLKNLFDNLLFYDFEFDFKTLLETDKVLALLLVNCSNRDYYINMLGRKKKEKFKGLFKQKFQFYSIFELAKIYDLIRKVTYYE